MPVARGSCVCDQRGDPLQWDVVSVATDAGVLSLSLERGLTGHPDQLAKDWTWLSKVSFKPEYEQKEFECWGPRTTCGTGPTLVRCSFGVSVFFEAAWCTAPSPPVYLVRTISTTGPILRDVRMAAATLLSAGR